MFDYTFGKSESFVVFKVILIISFYQKLTWHILFMFQNGIINELLIHTNYYLLLFAYVYTLGVGTFIF